MCLGKEKQYSIIQVPLIKVPIHITLRWDNYVATDLGLQCLTLLLFKLG